MALIVVARDSETHEVSLVVSEVFEDRKTAMKALQKLPKKVTRKHEDSEILLVDIEKATSVLLVSEDEGPEAVEVDADDAAAPEDEPSSNGLAGAIAKATESLESEGITAPESVGPETSRAKRRKSPFPEFEQEAEAGPLVDQLAPEMLLGEPVLEEGAMVAPADEDAEEAPDEAPIEEAPSADAPPEIEAEDEDAASGPDDAAGEASWPWEGGDQAAAAEPEPEPADAEPEAAEPEPEPADAEPEAAEPESDLASVIDSLEEAPAVAQDVLDDEDSLIRALGDEELLEAGSRAVVLGDYGDDVPEASVAPASESQPVVEAPDAEPDMTGAPAVGEALPVDESLKTSTYTCDDCVYENTCPKAHQADPSSCGSFQFRSI